ncbi:MAG: hypothetical protein FWD34_05620 [Oscillospiraceae bacterium]|nr:hypothetical protein [Oscillospiraceae bacterium]
MIHDIPKPEISTDFTVADIHKIRKWNYERLKDSTSQERKDHYKKSSDEFEALIKNARHSVRQ